MGTKVYLCGPITGLSYKGATDWRLHAAEVLRDAGFAPLSPMRGKAFLEKETCIQDSYGTEESATKHSIFNRDKFDCVRSEILLMNLAGASAVSIGSVMELAWSHMSGNFCVVVMEDGNPHVHAFVREAAAVIFADLDDALDYIMATFKE